MANKIYIEELIAIADNEKQQSSDQKSANTSRRVWVFPLLADINLEVQSNFASMTDGIPLIGSIVGLVKTIQSVSSATGGVSKGLVQLTNLFDAPRWEKTEPIKFTVDLPFYTKTNPKIDVVEPMQELMSYNILSINPENNTYTVPGVSLRAINLANQSEKSNPEKEAVTKAGDAKLISVKIPKVVYLPVAYIEKAVPVYSKQRTESGYPLWGTLNVTFSGVYPATTSILKNAYI